MRFREAATLRGHHGAVWAHLALSGARFLRSGSVLAERDVHAVDFLMVLFTVI